VFPKQLIRVVLAVGVLAFAQTAAVAQTAGWGAGITAFGGPAPLATASAGLYGARIVPGAKLRLEAVVSGPLTTAQGQGCISADCDTRYVGVLGSLGATFVGYGGTTLGGGAYPLLGAGVYASRWGGGTLESPSGSIPASKNEGPSGPYVTAGAGIPISGLGDGFRLELRVTQMFSSERGMTSIGISSLWLW
jgi:hypothetical protein